LKTFEKEEEFLKKVISLLNFSNQSVRRWLGPIMFMCNLAF